MRVQSIINLTNLLTLKRKLKSICKFCNKTKHKTLETMYKDNDTQCKICNKAVMYKKCIPCSTCGHLFHGKCLDFNKLDIIKIENICDFNVSTMSTNFSSCLRRMKLKTKSLN